MYPVLKDVKKVRVSPPKPGHIYPCLSDMETESEVQESEIEEHDNNRYIDNGSGNKTVTAIKFSKAVTKLIPVTFFLNCTAKK